jgi:RNA polymerase sigma-70 factor (ECF subfamily)
MLVRAHEQLAFRAAYLITRDRDEAADTAQDAFVNAHRSLESFELGQPFKPWLLRIVKNLALNRVRSAQRRAKATDRYHERLILETEDGSPEDMAAKRDQERRLLLAVLKLTPEEQWLVSLRYFLELPEDQVAQTLDIPLGTCKSRLHRTLARLREIIEDEALNSESSRTG